MTRRIDRLLGRTESVERYSLDQLATDTSFAFNGSTYPLGMQTTWGPEKAEMIGNNFEGYVQSAYRANGVVFAVILARQLLFTEARFQFQRLNNGRPGDLFGTKDLELLEVPWVNGTTGDLLAIMESDASLAGASFIARRGSKLRRMRPDWTGLVLGSPSGEPDDLDAEPLGYVYWQGGPAKQRPVTLLPEEVAHFKPIPDPLAPHRGMSWLTPILREIQADGMATRHKLKFFENAATPNMAVSLDKALSPEAFERFVALMSQRHDGVDNAYKTLYLGGGATTTVVGADLKQLDFKVTQGAGETRIAAAGGVPPVIVGLSEGLQQATYSNYGQARRKFADGWARPQWRMAAAALQSILRPPTGSRLWYDDRDISFLQEDQKDAAGIQQADAVTVKTLVDAGYTPESVVAAVNGRDMGLLVHSGLVSVQLQTPGTQPEGAPA